MPVQFLALIVIFIFAFQKIYAADSITLSLPKVSANTIFLYKNSSFYKDRDPTNPDQKRNGLQIQESEILFTSDVDPYTRMHLLLGVHPEYEWNGSETVESWVVEPEEAFIESNFLTNMIVRLGKFKASMGKHNLLHTHAYPFVEAPLANEILLGDEGFNDVGVSIAYLLPSSWYNELTIQFFRGEGENEEFRSPTEGDGVGLAHWKNFFDLSDQSTFEVGLSYAQGSNSLQSVTELQGADVTYKWRPSDKGRYSSFTAALEYLSKIEGQKGGDDERANGIASWFQYQFAERWAASYRFDNLFVSRTLDDIERPNNQWERHSVGLTYLPSEFSSIKFEYNERNGGPVNRAGQSLERVIFMQGNFSIGAHPSHLY